MKEVTRASSPLLHSREKVTRAFSHENATLEERERRNNPSTLLKHQCLWIVPENTMTASETPNERKIMGKTGMHL
jgi:hypothetical protein